MSIIKLVTFTLQVEISMGYFASNLEQATQANSDSSSKRNRKLEVANLLRGKGLVWVTRAVVYLLCCTVGPFFAIASNGAVV